MDNITDAQASNSLEFLVTLASEGLWYMLNDPKIAKETYNRNYDMRDGAYKTLKQFISEHKLQNEIKIIYEYKLRDEMTGMYRDASNWTKKGKTYRSRNNMNSAIAYILEPLINKVKPKYYIYKDGKNYDNPSYHDEYSLFRENNASREWRAQFIPETFIVECIPVNTKADILRINARDFYLGKKENDNVQTEQRSVDS